MGKRITDDERLERIKKVFPDEKEALSILEYDKAVERDETTDYDLTLEQQKVASQYIRTGTRKTPANYNFSKKKTRKSNETKAGLIAELAKFLAEGSNFPIENLSIENPERMITFQIDNSKFTVTLIQNRK